ncbi:MAG: glycosyltransferase family 4 protein [Gemmatimonadota bacterium]|nr:glycosyltransferase family 4 protein [Gemmatimonadota bacterium]
MKILLVNWQDPENPHAGGAEIHLREIFSRISAAGHAVTWLASGWKGAPSISTEADTGFEIHRVASRFTFGPASVLYYRRQLAGRNQGGFDLVVEALNKVPVYTPLWVREPAVLLVHHLFGTTAFHEAPAPIAAMTWLQERPIPRVYRHTPTQAISSSTKDDLVARGMDPRQIEVIHPGVDLGFFTPPVSPIRDELPTFLYLGRLKRYKRVDLILRAMAALKADGTAARLVIAGRGDDEPRLRALSGSLGLQENVFFAGFVSESEKRDLFRRAWANVFTSPKEGWGITNLEAAGCGTATIASDAPGLRESVVDDQTGFLVPHGDVGALANAMSRIATSRSLAGALGAGAHRFADGFTWELAAERTLAHLARVVDSSNRAFTV